MKGASRQQLYFLGTGPRYLYRIWVLFSYICSKSRSCHLVTIEGEDTDQPFFRGSSDPACGDCLTRVPCVLWLIYRLSKRRRIRSHDVDWSLKYITISILTWSTHQYMHTNIGAYTWAMGMSLSSTQTYTCHLKSKQSICSVIVTMLTSTYIVFWVPSVLSTFVTTPHLKHIPALRPVGT